MIETEEQTESSNVRKMEYMREKALLVLAFTIILFFPTVWSNIGDNDKVWQERAEEARKEALDAYQDDPIEVMNQFTEHENEDVKNSTSTRRSLKSRGKGDSCLATNPIDRCWRCQKYWAKNRQKLADCVLGFGHRTRGGKGGKYYVVTDSSDEDLLNPKPGTLRHAVIQQGPLWITFARSMVIKLQQELIIQSNKTIDGRGANVHIAYGAGLTLQFVKNVIIHGIRMHDIQMGTGGVIRDSVDHYGVRTQSDGDGISIFGATNIWIDHLSMSNCHDGLIDAIEGATAITISNCHFTNHNEVMLFGASDSSSKDQVMQITVAFNHFGKGLVQRMPRCRWGFFHVLNNDYRHWLMYAIGGSQHPTIISQGNRFTAPDNAAAKEVTKRDYAPESVWKGWTWRSEGDLLRNGAFFVQSGCPSNHLAMKNLLKAKPGSSVSRLTRFAGALDCYVNQPC